MAKIMNYTLTDREILENIFKNDNLLINHVVVPPGKVFPKHPTDAEVCIIIVRGELQVALEDSEASFYKPGQLVNIPKGTVSELGNTGAEPTELFVVKSGF